MTWSSLLRRPWLNAHPPRPCSRRQWPFARGCKHRRAQARLARTPRACWCGYCWGARPRPGFPRPCPARQAPQPSQSAQCACPGWSAPTPRPSSQPSFLRPPKCPATGERPRRAEGGRPPRQRRSRQRALLEGPQTVAPTTSRGTPLRTPPWPTALRESLPRRPGPRACSWQSRRRSREAPGWQCWALPGTRLLPSFACNGARARFYSGPRRQDRSAGPLEARQGPSRARLLRQSGTRCVSRRTRPCGHT
mmetsp:Transcript_18991/g.72517  ORF Transcript_18991/g.72517 Transcript_18991/m.72517 type:complete len:250 (+) Transcript_18991:3162-3911(+)